MKVTLINHTQNAERLLVFTKHTRLGLNANTFEDVMRMPYEEILKELDYMASTIPSSWEFCDYTFLIEGVSRAFTHQFVRNRHGSYAQESLRVVEKADIPFVMPERLTMLQQCVVGESLANIKNAIQALKITGAATEDIRSLLPTNVATNIVAKFNLRTMSELAKSRTGGRTQGEDIGVMNAMCDRVIEVHPWAEKFLFPQERNHFDEIEAFAERVFGGDLLKKGELLKIVDKMRKEK